ncbi:ATP-binding protein [Pyrococcus horikoshii]|uniref:AAA+ ATPase domain-containing protein n=2 Tax=Pyrococcus horikoshii TaxID=53953 RepID=O58652_PYRHO|nr:ATP-binding protein [Pyrococcus horikoshii]BAA30018.1 435aa long hypothetical protein [Pyrococcus horikoshii OT3]HII61226.1 ATP-binding protein [Pyrococcus horikoshii]
MIEHFNPWWKGREGIEEDEDYRKWIGSEVRWVPEVIKKISLEPFSLNIIFGPRQVGKTTLLKLIVKKLLDEGKNPRSIFYLRCDYISDYKELMNVIDEYLEIKETEGIKSSYILLDEVTFPKEWFRAIKLYIDMGKFRNDVLILTGSTSMYTKGEVETFPGRRGKGKDAVMLPLTFREFIKIASPKLHSVLPRINSLNKVEECLKAIPFIEELNSLFKLYLISGGFPRAVKDLLKHNKVSEETYETYISWMRGDILKLGKSEEVARRIMKTIIKKLPSPVSWHGIAKEIDIGSHKTVFSYIELFERMFLIRVLPYIDPDKLEADFKREKKVHLIDPFLYHLVSRWTLTEEPSEDKIVESVVATHVARRYEVGYWRDGREIDVVTREGVGIEVKWSDNVKVSPVKVGKIRKVITLSKSKFSRDPLVIPVSVFLSCI